MRRVAFFFLFLVLALWILQGWLLPCYLENYLIPRFASNAGFSRVSCRVRHIGLSGLEIGPVELVTEQKPALRVGAVFVSYSPFGLAGKHLKDIHISGLTIPLIRQGETTTLAGAPFFSEKNGGSEPGENMDEKGFHLPVQFQSVTIDGAKIIYQDEVRAIHLPFRLEIAAAEKSALFGVRAEFQVGDRMLGVNGEVDLNIRNIHGDIKVKGLPLSQATAWGLITARELTGGSIDAEVDFNASFNPLSIKKAIGKLRFQGLSWCMGDFSLSQSAPLDVQGVWQGERKLGIRMSPLHFDGSVIGTFILDNLALDLGAAETSLNGSWALALERFSHGQTAVSFEEGLNFSGALAGRRNPEKGWSMELSAEKMPAVDRGVADIALTREQAFLWLGKDRLTCRGEATVARTHFDCELGLEKFRGRFPQGRIQLGDVQLQGSWDSKNGEGESKPQTRIAFKATDVKLSGDELSVVAPRLEGSAANNLSENPTGFWQGDIRMNKARLDYPSQVIAARNISFFMPWQYPVTGPQKPGQFRIGAIRHQGQKLGSIQGRLQQKKAGWFWDGRWSDILHPATILYFRGQADTAFSEAALNFNLDRPSFDLGSALAGYEPKLRGVEGKGDLQLRGELQWADQRLFGPVQFSLLNLDCLDKKSKFQGQGLNLTLEFADLPSLYATGRQLLTFEKLSLADVVLEKGRINFLVERNLEFLIEKLAFDWSGGRVFSESFRVRPGAESLDIVLYCDRVKLVQVLEQLGAARAEGTGSLNGRIPLRYEKGQFSVVDGFLFSTPGEGGILHVSGMESLTAGLPGDNRYFGQLKLAEEALKNYEYKWARLVVNSEDDDLMVKVQMDGHPTGPLPFVYRKDFGGFVRAEANFPGTKFEGIRLDLNFRLPLNKMLEYKNLFKLMK